MSSAIVPPHTSPPSFVITLSELGKVVEPARGKVNPTSAGSRLYTAADVMTLKVEPGKKVSPVANGSPG